MMEDLELMMKVIVVGDGRIGKTCLITRFVRNIFLEEYKKTLGVDFLQRKHFIKDLAEEVEFYIWDTAGQEEFNSLTRKYYKGASACILAFSTTDRDSFEHVEKWRNAVEDECGDIPTVLVQTKIDLIDNAVMTTKESEQLAKKLQLPIFKICSKDNIMVTEVFEYLAVKYFSRNLHKQEGHAPIQSLGDIKASSMSTSLASNSWNANQTHSMQQQQHNKSGGNNNSNISRGNNSNMNSSGVAGNAAKRGNIKLGASHNKDNKQNKKNKWFSAKCTVL